MVEGGIDCEMMPVQTRADFVAALEEGGFDLILAGYPGPPIDGLSALELAREVRPEVPVIVVSGRAGEELAIDSLKSGATDYVLKHRLERLVPAVRRAIRESEERRERARAEETLRTSEHQFRTLVEQIPAATYTQEIAEPGKSRAKPTLYASPQIESQLGYPPQAFVEDPGLWIRLLHPEDRNRVLAEDRRTDATGEPFVMEYRQIARDGRVVWLRDEAVLVRDEEGRPRYWKGVQHDITKRKRVEEELRESEERFRATFEQAAVGMGHAAPDGRMLRVNQRFCDIVGHTREELLEKTFEEFTHPEDVGADSEQSRQLLAGEIRTYTMEKRYIRKDGSVVWVDLTVSLVRESSGEPGYFIAVVEDVTERKHAEQSLRRSLTVMLALREAGQMLSSTLSSEEIISSLLELMRSVSDLTTVLISIRDQDGELRVWRSAGLEGLRRKARFEREAEAARLATLADEEPRLFRLHNSGSEGSHPVGLCLPLRIKDKVVGVLEAYGRESLADSDSVEILSSLAGQAASALENARLYEELGERERALQDLVGKLLTAQEEEHRRIAYEVHDGLAQVAVAAHQRLQAFAQRHSPSTERGQRDLERILGLVRATVSDARRIIANLRPTTLDDLGLTTTLSLEVERLREDGYEVNFEESLGDERLPEAVEIALFRISQEALTNVRKHAQTRLVHIRLSRSRFDVLLEVRDYGRGFDPDQASAGSGPGERVGLAGMRERVAMLGGTLTIRSDPDAGTSVVASVPLSAMTVTATSVRHGSDDAV